jgi:hypothetical protein
MAHVMNSAGTIKFESSWPWPARVEEFAWCLAGPDRHIRWPSRLVATAAEDRQSRRSAEWRRFDRMNNQTELRNQEAGKLQLLGAAEGVTTMVGMIPVLLTQTPQL